MYVFDFPSKIFIIFPTGTVILFCARVSLRGGGAEEALIFFYFNRCSLRNHYRAAAVSVTKRRTEHNARAFDRHGGAYIWVCVCV